MRCDGRFFRSVIWTGICLVGMASLAAGATQDVVRTVRGTVLATSEAETPPTIVVKVVLPDRQELIVGATISPDTVMLKGKRPVRLAEIAPDAQVTVTYVKSLKGLAARAIHLEAERGLR